MKLTFRLLMFVILGFSTAVHAAAAQNPDPCVDSIRQRICVENGPACAPASAEETSEVLAIYQRSHPIVQKTLCSLTAIKIASIFSLAQAQVVQDQTGKPVTAFIIIRKSLLEQHISAETALSWKEQKVFSVVLPEFDLNPGSPRFYVSDLSALEYAINHEIGHVVDFFNRANWFKCANNDCGNPFDPNRAIPTAGSWGSLSWASLAKVTPENSFPLLEKLCFYGCTPTLKNEEATAFYRGFSQTMFATTYALISPQEDFAESFTFEVLLKRKNLKTEVSNGQFRINLSLRWAQNPKSLWLQTFLAKPLAYPSLK